MAIVVVSQDTPRLLSTVAAVKTEFGITESSDDALLSTCITQASALIVSYLGRELITQRQRETVRGYGTLNLRVSVTPVVTIHSVKYGEDPAALTTMATTDYTLMDANAGLIRSRKGGWAHSAGMSFGAIHSPRAGSEYCYYEVDYTGGYDGDLTTLPADITRACNELVRSIYYDVTLVSESLPDVYSATYQPNSTGGETWKNLLAPWRTVSL